LKLDKELDGKYEDIGLARGHAADDILDIKEALWAEVLERNHVNADDALQGSIAATKKKLDALEEEVKRLTEREGDVVARLKELSDETMGAFDKAAQMFNKRSELPGIINDQTAQMIFDQIKGAPDAIADIEKGLTKPEGVVPRLDKAIADARAQMNVVTGMLTDLEKEDVDVAGKIAETEGHDKAVREEQVAAEESGDIVEHTVEETTVAPKKKRSKKSKESWIPDWVSTDLFHKAYAAVAGFGSACWEVVRPVRIMCMKIYTHLTRKLFGNKGEQAAAVALKVKDPVLARIEIERQQSQKKVNDLSQQRHLIREKEELLDRLEVERVMQLERKDEVAAQLDRSYRRGARKELSWFDLGKRFVWKAYGSFRRGMSRLAQWWQEARAEVSGKAVVDKKPVAKPQQSEEVVVQTDVSPQKASEEVSTQASEEVSEFDALYMDDEAEESEDDDSDAMMMEDDMQGDEYAEEGVSVEDAVKQAVAGREEKLTVTEKAAKAFADGSGDKAQLAADMMMSKDEQDVAAQRAQKLAAEASAAVKAAQASVAQVTAKTAK
jgi:hypothetical protein